MVFVMMSHFLFRLPFAGPLLVCLLAFACDDVGSSDSPDEDTGVDTSSGGRTNSGGSANSTGGTSAGGTSSGGDTSSGGRSDLTQEFAVACSAAKAERTCEAITLPYPNTCVDCGGACVWGLFSELSLLPNQHVVLPNADAADPLPQGGMGGAEPESPACYLMVGDGG